MLARIRKAAEEREGGFTLIELLVVIIIIGILAAIAIPVFLNQRQKGYDAQAKADLRNLATAEETYLTDSSVYTKTVANLTNAVTGSGFRYSNASAYDSTVGQVITVKLDGTASGFCATAKSASGKTWAYDSENGGLQTTAGYACPAQFT